jgi:hypothetical protein
MPSTCWNRPSSTRTMRAISASSHPDRFLSIPSFPFLSLPSLSWIAPFPSSIIIILLTLSQGRMGEGAAPLPVLEPAGARALPSGHQVSRNCAAHFSRLDRYRCCNLHYCCSFSALSYCWICAIEFQASKIADHVGMRTPTEVQLHARVYFNHQQLNAKAPQLSEEAKADGSSSGSTQALVQSEPTSSPWTQQEQATIESALKRFPASKHDEETQHAKYGSRAHLPFLTG